MLSVQEVKEVMYEGYVALYNLRVSTRTKHRMFSELTAENPDNWRVVGITEAALKEFAKNDFNRPTTVCRAHTVERIQTSRDMFDGPLLDIDAWWELYTSRDQTVIATKSENMRKEAEISAYDVPAGLFRTSGFAFKCGKPEKEFLKSLISG